MAATGGASPAPKEGAAPATATSGGGGGGHPLVVIIGVAVLVAIAIPRPIRRVTRLSPILRWLLLLLLPEGERQRQRQGDPPAGPGLEQLEKLGEERVAVCGVWDGGSVV